MRRSLKKTASFRPFVVGLMKSKCCKKFKRKGKSCKRCPVMAGLGKKQRKKLVAA